MSRGRQDGGVDDSPGAPAPPQRKPWYTVLYIQVLIAIALGVARRAFLSADRRALKPLGDAFINADQDDDRAGDFLHRGARHRFDGRSQEDRPGRRQDVVLFRGGVHAGARHRAVDGRDVCSRASASTSIRQPSTPRRSRATSSRAGQEGVTTHLMNIIPNTFVGAFAGGDLLQVLLVSILTGFAISRMGKLGEQRMRMRSTPWRRSSSASSRSSCGSLRSARSAPWRSRSVHSGSARCGSWSSWSWCSMRPASCSSSSCSALIARFAGFSIFRFIAYIKDELLIVRRHVVLGDGAAADDPEDAAAGRLEVGGRPGDPDRLQLQSRRHQHLHDAGHVVPRAGHQHAADATARSSASSSSR